jgi:hypothetical protein
VREVPNVVSEEPFLGTDAIVPEENAQSTQWVGERVVDGAEGMDGTPSTRAISMGGSATPVREVLDEASVFVGNVATDHDPSGAYDTEIYDMDAYMPVAPVSVYTRATDPFNPA